jgi:hypothetical protein
MALLFSDLMVEFCELYLTPDWEEDLCRKLMGTSMNIRTFWEYTTKVQSQNILLIRMNLHLTKDKLRHQLKVGMMNRLSKKCKADKVQDIVKFHKWLLEVKQIDDAMCALDCKMNPMGEPSCRANVLNVSNYNSNASSLKGRTGNTKPVLGHLPKLTEDEHTLPQLASVL